MKIISNIGIILLIAICGCREASKEKNSNTAQPGADIDKIQLTDLKGGHFDIKQYKGKKVFINFWATWCKPCIAEMASIERAQNILKDAKVVFLLASNETLREIEDFKNNNDYTFTYTKVENFEALNIPGLPTTFIFGPEGKLVFSEMGSRNWDDSTNIQMILKINRQND